MTAVPWWRSYFDDRYFEMHDPLFNEERSRIEVAGMRELLALPHGARVLDAPCGWGRHTALLAEAGLDVFGADLSYELLHRAPHAGHNDAADDDRDDSDDHDLGDPDSDVSDSVIIPPRYTAADIRALPFGDASFDAVINVFTSLGLFLNDDDDVAALLEARRVLRPGGALLLESMHRDEVIAQYAERDRWTLPDGTEVRVRRRFDPVAGVSHERLQWRKGEQRGRKRHSLRLRTATEIDALLRAAGFSDIAYFGNWQGARVSYRRENLIAVARMR